MGAPETLEELPNPAAIDDVFFVYEINRTEDDVRYYGTPVVGSREVIQALWPRFREHGYDIRLDRELGEWVLIAEPSDSAVNGIPWTNIILAVATVLSTLFAGAHWYHLDPFSAEIIHAWPFAAAIMGVLGVHELGHYVMSRYHGVDASLPYFIPLPTLIGTMGAVIKMKGHIPSRRALFDIGVAGPLAGLVATIAVTIIGLHLPPVIAPPSVIDHPDAVYIQLGYPPLMEFLAWMVDQPLTYEDARTSVNPVVIGGWVGMFVTFLNMIPVGQLDGGHVVRSVLGDRQEVVAAVVPAILFGLAGYLFFIADVSLQGVMIWGIWGVIATIFMAVGPAAPLDETKLGRSRILIGLLTFAIGLLCFTPVPVEIHM